MSAIGDSQSITNENTPDSPSHSTGRPSVRILGRGDGVVVEVSDAANSWSQVLEMLASHLNQANGFFRGERIVLDLGPHAINRGALASLLDLLHNQEISLRMLRTSNEDVHHLAQELGVSVTLQVQPHFVPSEDSEVLSELNWEVYLQEQQTPALSADGEDDGGIGQAAHAGVATADDEVPVSPPGAQTSGTSTFDTSRAESAYAPAVRSSILENEDKPELLQRVLAPPYLYRGTLRSGQVFRHAGPVIVIGDVNPGAQLISGGDVYVWGRLRGMIHAGAMGDENAVVGALDFEPIQLRIAGHIAMTPKGDEQDPGRWFWKRNAEGRPEVARVQKGRIVVDLWDARLG